MTKVIVDTNYLIEQDNLEEVVEQYKVVIPIVCLEELDSLNHNSIDQSKKFRIRNAIRQIEKYTDKIEIDIKKYDTSELSDFDEHKNDNKILLCCKNNNAILLTYDVALKIKARSIGIKCIETKEIEKDVYLGYKEIELTDEELSQWYTEEMKFNKWNLLENEFLVIKNSENDIVDIWKWTSTGFKQLKYKNLKSKFLGNISPRNIQQKLLFDIMQDDNIKIKAVKGTYGVGKDFVQLAHAIDMLEKNKVEKIVWVRNITSLRNVPDIGFLPGTMTEKLYPFAQIMCDHLGGEEGLKYFMSNGKIELQHLGYIRGRSYKNCILYCSEAENMTKELMQLLISRCGEGSYVFLNGDYKQVDGQVFQTNNGLNTLIDAFKGYDEFGYIELEKVERSKIAQMASLLD